MKDITENIINYLKEKKISNSILFSASFLLVENKLIILTKTNNIMKNEQKSISQLEKAGYKGTKVMSMIKAIESQEIFKHLRLVQQDEFARVKKNLNG